MCGHLTGGHIRPPERLVAKWYAGIPPWPHEPQRRLMCRPRGDQSSSSSVMSESQQSGWVPVMSISRSSAVREGIPTWIRRLGSVMSPCAFCQARNSTSGARMTDSRPQTQQGGVAIRTRRLSYFELSGEFVMRRS
jgi:hypothetical protein